ncbi:hypothetical protein AGMMS49992_30590 [Clostridia bacterium]|nr:hypothetical protein AGMMS49992_30590 [Clostridia bacterium]
MSTLTALSIDWGNAAQWVAILITGIFAFLAHRTSKENYRLAYDKKIKDETPCLIIKDQILDEKWDRDPLNFVTDPIQFHNERRSVGMARAKLERLNGVDSKAYFTLVVNTADNSEPDECLDNYCYIILSSIKAPIKLIEITGSDIYFHDGSTLHLEANTTDSQNMLNPLGDNPIHLYVSFRSNNDIYSLSTLKLMKEKWSEKYSKTDNGSTINLPVESGLSTYYKMTFDLILTSENDIKFAETLFAEVRNKDFIYEPSTLPIMI